MGTSAAEPERCTTADGRDSRAMRVSREVLANHHEAAAGEGSWLLKGDGGIDAESNPQGRGQVARVKQRACREYAAEFWWGAESGGGDHHGRRGVPKDIVPHIRGAVHREETCTCIRDVLRQRGQSFH